MVLVDTNDTTPTSQPSAPRLELKSLAKSKDEAFQGRTFYVRKKTYAQCDYLLKSTEDPRDMSDLAEELLSEWLHKEPKTSTF